MHQVHAEGAVRHAEKRRRGTCTFANRIARISLDAYTSTVPDSYREVHKQTCVAAIVACFELESKNEGKDQSNNHQSAPDSISPCDHLQVMSLGVGTKFLSEQALKQDQQSVHSYGKRIRDCHAEVLARRAFRRQLLEEILADLHGKQLATSDYVPILERVVEGQLDGTGKEENDSRPTPQVAKRFKSDIISIDNTTAQTSSRLRYSLKSNVTLHFYASSAPCGNATLKKFVKMEKEVFDNSLVRLVYHEFFKLVTLFTEPQPSYYF
jgi:double-stranded RNA-specific adenosine deaminase